MCVCNSRSKYTGVLLQVGNRLGVKRCSDDTMHIFIDGEDVGPAATAVAKVHVHTHNDERHMESDTRTVRDIRGVAIK